MTFIIECESEAQLPQQPMNEIYALCAGSTAGSAAGVSVHSLCNKLVPL